MTKKLILGTLAMAIVIPVQADDIEGGTLKGSDWFAIGSASYHNNVPEGAAFSNISSFTGAIVTQGPAGLQADNGITRLIADDINPEAGSEGKDIVQFTFSVANMNDVDVSARARVRFWYADGPDGRPGNYYNSIGYTFVPFKFTAGMVTLATANIDAGFKLPKGKFWAGVTFDNDNGRTGATLDQLSNLGQGIFDPVNRGSSEDQLFITDRPGSFFNTSNPRGALFNLGGEPAANTGWEFQVVPEPASLAVLGLGLLTLLVSRRKA